MLSLPGGGWLKVSGMGNAKASYAATELAEKGATAFLSWGTAGGLIDSLRPGSVIVPKHVISPDGRSMAVDAEWRKALVQALAGHVALCGGAVIESPGVLAAPHDKTLLFQRSGAAAVDMESAAIGTVAQRRGAPFLVVRVVVDPGWQCVPRAALNGVDADGHLRPTQILLALAREPRTFIDLARLALQFRAAQVALRIVAAVGMSVLSGPPGPATPAHRLGRGNSY